ncbi:GspH/FimT family pseudopilin [Xanthomonas dyei]|uniref:GspH/FimT family pseudopilin n=1 Tax=Xanthomonas dyei TaxID=743699 RepID=UPI001E4238A2|nr:GspH/FimT family pseudopilin [Xanthomonas dyei]MCC4635300.1 GspH/FimT family pseudopilin [Xanthomonas dyei pv. eucalypti]
MRQLCSQAGFNLIESILVLAVLAVATSIALPSLNELRQRHQARAATAELSAHLALARSASIALGSSVAVCPSTASNSCMASHDWTRGWLVYTDPDGNRKPDRASDIIAALTTRASSTISIRTTIGRTQVRYDSLGTAQGTNATFNICRGSYLDTQVIVSMAGRARAQRHTPVLPCPSS